MSKLRLRTDRLDWREVDGEIVALEAQTSTYVAANRAGAVLWGALARGADREELVQRLTATFGIDARTARADVDRFVEDLDARGLLER